MVHRRIPKKTNRRKKLKSVDPFNKNKPAFPDKKFNRPPSKEEEQTTSRHFSDLLKNEPSINKRKKRPKGDPNLIEGFERKPWETDRQFLGRVHRETEAFVNEQKMKIKYDLVGTEPLGIQEEVRRLKDEMREYKRKMRESRGLRDPETEPEAEATTSTEVLTDEVPEEHADAIRNRDPDESAEEKSAKRKRKYRKMDRLQQTEVIRFGERTDAPPMLTSVPRKAVARDRSQKAGNKQLLLNQMLRADGSAIIDRNKVRANDATIKCAGNPDREQLLREERARVIQLYRGMKQKRTA